MLADRPSRPETTFLKNTGEGCEDCKGTGNGEYETDQEVCAD